MNLRLKDVDLEVLEVTIPSGKGDRDRVTVLPGSLVPEWKAWKEELRSIYEADRAGKLPGVAMPKALERIRRTTG